MAATLALVVGCGEETKETAAPAYAETTAEAEICDAGDEAFIKRAIPLMWGRKPGSIREVAVLTQLVQASSRGTVIEHMARSPEYLQRWWYFFQDALAVNRAGKRSNALCYQSPLQPTVTPQLAVHIRDHAPDAPAFESPWNMADLMLSALMLDDLSPVYLAQLFGQQGTVIVPLDEPYEEHVNRKNYAAIFERTYLNRRMECLTCHNSSFSVTGSTDPTLDRTWEIPGYFEAALYGEHTGQPSENLWPFFRAGGLLALEELPHEQGPSEWFFTEGRAPWGIDLDCGQYVASDAINPDPLEGTGHFISAHGDTANIWDLEHHLRAGFDALRDGTLDPPDATQPLTLDGDEAFAHLVATNVANQVWAAAQGSRLTIANYFPRNREQRDILLSLTQALIDNDYSLVALLVAATTHPLFNPLPPAACQTERAYPLPPVYDPYTVDYDDPALRGNGVGDTVRRLPARTLIWSVTQALNWTLVPDFFGMGEGYQYPPAGVFQRDVGAYLKDTSMGFSGIDFRSTLAWETAYGACVDPRLAGDEGVPEHNEVDWIETLVTHANDEHTVRDAVRALKDRLLTDPSLEPTQEEPLLEALMGVPLDQKLSSLPEAQTALRRACAAFLASPQFLMEGDVGPDRLTATTPNLVLPGTAFQDYCVTLTTLLYDTDEVACGANAVTLNTPTR